MIKFYVARLSMLKSKEGREDYLHNTVVETLRDQVRDAWNAEHPDEPID